MSKPRYNLLLRLRACWRVLTGRTWAVYVPDGPSAYRMGWQGMTRADVQALRQWASDREADLNAMNDTLATALNLNPGIAPAPDA